MKIHRFIGDFDLNKENLEIKGEIAKQMAQVLKLKPGEKIELCDGKDISAMAEIVEINKKKVVVKLATLLRSTSFAGQNSTKQVNLFCAVLKKENFELVVQKATECGVSKIIPIITDRTIKTGLKLDRLEKIAKEASEQSGRITVTEITEPINFKQATEGTHPYSLNILFDRSGSPLGGETAKSENINIFIGPEGGWTEKEIEFAKKNNFKIASLGPLTLRGETAAIVATYLAVNIK